MMQTRDNLKAQNRRKLIRKHLWLSCSLQAFSKFLWGNKICLRGVKTASEVLPRTATTAKKKKKKNVSRCNQESKGSDGEAPLTTAWANSTICWEDFSVSILYLNIVSGDEDGNDVRVCMLRGRSWWFHLQPSYSKQNRVTQLFLVDTFCSFEGIIISDAYPLVMRPTSELRTPSTRFFTLFQHLGIRLSAQSSFFIKVTSVIVVLARHWY